MRILLYGINYYPELTGSGKYSGEACEWLAKQGHEVEVITAMPYYPAWEINENYQSKWWHTEVINGVTVHRCPLYVPSNVTAFKRILLETSFVLASFIYWFKIFFTQKFEAVICVCPPFQLGLLPYFYSKLRGVAFIYHIQDLQVDMVNDLEMIKNKKVIKALFWVEKFIMNGATVISSISDGMLKKLKNKKLKVNNYLLFPNWVDTVRIKPLSSKESLREELGYKADDIIVQYSGTIAEKQGLEMIIEVAKELPLIQFMMVGEGGFKQKLIEKVENAKLNNIRFFPLQPYNKLSNLLVTGDIHLVLQKKSASDLVLPSKLTSILSAGTFAIVTASEGTSLYEIINAHKAGVLVEPESLNALKEAIVKYSQEDTTIYKSNGRLYAQKYLDKEQIMLGFEKNLQKLSIVNHEVFKLFILLI
jgi:colanic acid biosynthesis glycosyl transferase WcaI